MLGRDSILEQMDSALRDYEKFERDDTRYTFLITKMCSCIERFAPPDSQYLRSMNQITAKGVDGFNSLMAVGPVAQILRALREAYDQGYLDRLSDLIHANLFSDFLEMAEHLLGEGYKDPSAVIIGSVLEEHLRQLCAKHSILTDHSGKPKKANTLNADLAAAQAYSKLDQKSITSWLDLRNKAAHGKYTEYSEQQVALLLHSVRDFMVRVPA